MKKQLLILTKNTTMKRLLFVLAFILLCLPMIGFGQNVNIPDALFKAYLVGNSLINTNGDSEIQVSEATAFNGSISCASSNISDLTGIEDFTALTYLNCFNNQLTSLNVSGATALEYLDCGVNQLTSLDVSNNIALTELVCGYNQLTSLDLSNNISLGELDCNNNQLTSLDVSQNTNLWSLECQSNLLECLNISNNPDLTEVNFQSNLLEQLNLKNGNWSILDPNALSNNLTCVEVDNIGYATNNWAVGFDSFVTFSTNCNYTNPCNTNTAIQEHTTNKKLLKVTDLLGRETKQTNQPLLYLYDNGTVEKRIVIE